MSLTFSQAYHNLNPAQKKAVDAIEGPVMVVAGPGTGKTQVLALRIANILKKTDTSPKNILALTFTESAAKNMRERVVSFIGLDGYKVNIETFHAFCRRVVSEHPEYFPVSSVYEDPDEASELPDQVVSELEQFALIQEILNDPEARFELLKPLKKPDLYVRSILKAISDLKREGVTPDEFLAKIELEWPEAELKEVKSKAKRQKLEKLRAKNLELQKVYQLYEAKLHNLGKYDFNDMIMMVLLAFKKHPDLLLDYQEQLHYFLVDEYQDTNTAQNEVVELLASYWQDQANIFVVGDPHQSIFRFQGASLANMSRFLSRYPKAQVINLKVGYRCPQPIYNSAFELMCSLSEDGSKHQAKLTQLLNFNQPLKSALAFDKQLSHLYLYEAPTKLAEYIYLAKKINQLIKSGTKPEEIAVLYRNNAESLELMQVLDKWGLAYDVAGGGNALDLEEIRQLVHFLRVVYLLREGADYVDLFEVLSYEWVWVDKLLAMKLARLANRQGLSLVDLVEKDNLKSSNGQGVLKILPSDKELIQQFLDELRELGSLDLRLPFVKFFEQVIENSGYLAWLQKQPNSHELILALNSLFNQIKALNYEDHDFHLRQFLETIELMQQYRLTIKVDDLNIKTNRITLSTVHKAKGLEWEHVFVVGLVDKKWGNKRNGGTQLTLPTNLVGEEEKAEDQEAEERRLFYVALTRASQAVYLSYPKTEVLAGRVKEYMPSEFVTFLKEKDLVSLVDHQVDQEIEKDLAQVLRPAPEKLSVDKARKDFFQHLVDKFSLSVSALNKYLKDPKAFALETLVRIPKAKPENMAYGTAVHKALEKFNRRLIEEGRQMELNELLAEFETALGNELMTESELERWLAKGKESLASYYNQRLAAQSAIPLKAERNFSKIYLDDIRLTGKIDKVEWLDPSKNWVRVVDYKTGKARSLNEIEAKTQTSKEYLSERELRLPEFLRGEYKRQLLFYKILADLDSSFPYEVKQAALEFVEPSRSGKVAPPRVFEFKEAELEAMRQLIREVIKEIRNLEFLEVLE